MDKGAEQNHFFWQVVKTKFTDFKEEFYLGAILKLNIKNASVEMISEEEEN